eukprot:365127-Chlamydomonas_euryale.AAC.3
MDAPFKRRALRQTSKQTGKHTSGRKTTDVPAVHSQAGTVLSRIWCLYEAWQSGRKGPGSLLLLSYGITFNKLEKASTKGERGGQEGRVNRVVSQADRDAGQTAARKSGQAGRQAVGRPDGRPDGQTH